MPETQDDDGLPVQVVTQDVATLSKRDEQLSDLSVLQPFIYSGCSRRSLAALFRTSSASTFEVRAWAFLVCSPGIEPGSHRLMAHELAGSLVFLPCLIGLPVALLDSLLALEILVDGFLDQPVRRAPSCLSKCFQAVAGLLIELDAHRGFAHRWPSWYWHLL